MKPIDIRWDALIATLPARATFAVSVSTCADLYARSQQAGGRRATDLLGAQPWLKWQVSGCYPANTATTYLSLKMNFSFFNDS